MAILSLLFPSSLESNCKTVMKYKRKFDNKKTLISLGTFNIFFAKVVSMDKNKWVFSDVENIYGDQDAVYKYEEFFEKIRDDEKFIVCEKENKARKISSIFSNKKNGEPCELVVEIEKLPIYPGRLDGVADLGFDDDLIIENGDLKLVQGLELFSQIVYSNMSLGINEVISSNHRKRRELQQDPRTASLVPLFCNVFYNKNKNYVLESLIKLDIIRLSSITYISSPDYFYNEDFCFVLFKSIDDNGDEMPPPFSFVDKVVYVKVEEGNDNCLVKYDLITEHGDRITREKNIPINSYD